MAPWAYGGAHPDHHRDRDVQPRMVVVAVLALRVLVRLLPEAVASLMAAKLRVGAVVIVLP